MDTQEMILVALRNIGQTLDKPRVKHLTIVVTQIIMVACGVTQLPTHVGKIVEFQNAVSISQL